MLLFFKQPLAQVPHRIPHREEPYGDNRYEYQYNVRCMHAHRIGVHYKTSVAAAQRYKSEALLQETQQQPQYNPGNCSEHRNQPPFKKEDTAISRSSAPRLRSVSVSSRLSSISMDSEPITLKQAIVSIKVRNR